jgi:hypothetical protein
MSAKNTVAAGVEYETIAREWRFKWNPDSEKKSLVDAQSTLQKYLMKIKSVEGVKNVQRVVCGGCHDFKVIVSLPAELFSKWVRYHYSLFSHGLTCTRL